MQGRPSRSYQLSASRLLICMSVVSFAWCIVSLGQDVGSKSRAEQVSALESRIIRAPSLAEKIEMERTMAYLWLGVGCSDPADASRFTAEAGRILKKYSDVAYHYSYLDIKITYAQLLPSKERDALLWDVIAVDPREILAPAGENTAKCVNRLKQGAIWAYLNAAAGDAVTAKADVQARRVREEAEKLSARLNETEEGRRCAPLVGWWRDTLLADRPGSVRIPAVAPPPPSKWDAVAEAPQTAPVVPATQPVVVAVAPATRPEIQRTFDSVECFGTVTVDATPLPPPARQANWSPWVLGGAGIVLLMAGLALVWRGRRTAVKA